MANKSDYNFWDFVIHGVFFSLYGFVKYVPSPMGDILRKVILKFFIKEMKKVRIYEGVTFWYPYRLRIGSNVTLNENIYISAYGNVNIGDNVRIGNRTSIISSDHIIPSKQILIKDAGVNASPVAIEDDVYIGCNVTILKGVKIGKGSVIGACSLVNKSIPPYTIYAGVPAKFIKDRNDD